MVSTFLLVSFVWIDARKLHLHALLGVRFGVQRIVLLVPGLRFLSASSLCPNSIFQRPSILFNIPLTTSLPQDRPLHNDQILDFPCSLLHNSDNNCYATDHASFSGRARLPRTPCRIYRNGVFGQRAWHCHCAHHVWRRYQLHILAVHLLAGVRSASYDPDPAVAVHAQLSM